MEGGAVTCWGWNQSGQLGDGTTEDRPFPVAVQGLTEGVVKLAAGASHSCALLDSRHVTCWGLNVWGQLGSPTGPTCPSGLACNVTPVEVAGVSDVIALAGGVSHTCVLGQSGGVQCWGRNQYGQLGDGTNTNSAGPVNVSGLASGVTAISIGGFHACALLTGGGVKCWGNNATGQLGNGTTTNSSLPVDVTGLPAEAVAISAGNQHTCAVLATSSVVCWGDNVYGKLGDGTSTQQHLPVAVSGLSNVSAVAAADDHTCALTLGGALKCWGQNSYGQAGDGTLMRRYTPVDVVGMSSDVSRLFTGGLHTCALTTTGVLRCWGDNSEGQLGVQTDEICPFSGVSCSSVPLDVLAMPKATPTATAPATTATPTSTPLPPTGDANCDGLVNAVDATLVLQHEAGLLGMQPCFEFADANSDGQLDSLDAALILQYSAHLIDALPA